MNKARTGNSVQVKRVAPPIAPIVPGLVSFASFRVKKGQSSRDSSSTTLSVESEEKEKQRYSGSSLGSAGSSYTTNSSGSSNSSSGDNRSSFGADDGFLLPPPTDYILKGEKIFINQTGGGLVKAWVWGNRPFQDKKKETGSFRLERQLTGKGRFRLRNRMRALVR